MATRNPGAADSTPPRVAIVTDASSGIGLEIARRLLADNYKVVANARHMSTSNSLDLSSCLRVVDGDIGDPSTSATLVQTAVETFGRLDLLVNNAGVFIPKPFTEYTETDYRIAVETNMSGFFHASQHAVARMREQRFGHIVTISTSLVAQPIASVSAGLANLTKGALESITRALAIEFASVGVRFNAIAPGVVNTPMNPAEAHGFLKTLSPLNRLAEVGEIADLLLYLERAPFVNGEIIHIEGGAHAGKW